jgi:predicted nucleic acid-binding protein
MKYLVDTSALVRIWRRQVDSEWRSVANRGLITICEPVLAETLVSATAKAYSTLEAELRETYPYAMVPDDIWRLVTAIRRELVPHSAYQGLSVADLVIAATAIRLKLTLLHEDGDFETIARFVPELSQYRISAGPPAAN